MYVYAGLCIFADIYIYTHTHIYIYAYLKLHVALYLRLLDLDFNVKLADFGCSKRCQEETGFF